MTNDAPNLGEGLYDPRAVANLILEVIHKPISNLTLQKLLYFVHGAYILRKKKALVTGYFEAWNYGPVHPAVYQAFKEFEGKPINVRAMSKNIRTGELSEISLPDDQELTSLCRKVVHSLEDMTASQLVNLSHAPGGPWHEVLRRSKREHMLGLRISNEAIRERYRNHWLGAERLNSDQEFTEDAPLTYHRFS